MSQSPLEETARITQPERRTIGKYEIRRPLASGGFGSVFEAWDPLIRRQVAVKVCGSASREMRLRFAREAEIVGNLDHPNIVKVFDFGRDGDLPYLVQEFLSGQDLDDRLASPPPLTYPEKLLILLQIARGLEYAHRKGIVHRDVKPANVRLLDDGAAKLMDFGIATSKEADIGLTQAGTTVGTAAYLAPERVRGHTLDHRCDMFSYGVTAYEILAGRRPFSGETISRVLFQIVNEQPEPLSTVCSDAPRALAELVARCLEKDRDQRWEDMGEVRRRLEGIRDEARRKRRRTEPRETAVNDDEESIDLADVTLAGVDAEPLLFSRSSPPRWRVALLTILLLATALAAVIVTRKGSNDLVSRSAAGKQSEPPPDGSGVASASAAPVAVADSEPSATASENLPAPATAGAAPPADADSANRSETPPLPALVTLSDVWSPRIRVAVDEGLPQSAENASLTLTPGRHALHFMLEAPRYSARETVTVEVRAGERLTVPCPLVPPGLVTVQPVADSPNGAVFLNGRLRGNSPLRRLVLEPGEYQLRILPRAATGAGVASTALTVESRVELLVSFDLTSPRPIEVRERPLRLPLRVDKP